ncbi:MAG TPA: flagellar export chaperone FliS [Burkholderiaceae bacterium]
MFSTSPYLGSRKPATLAYREVDASTALDGASPHKLVSLLYATLAGQIANARGALARRDIAEKGRAIGHAVRILEEGLRAPLDLQAGGAIAANLHDLYEYMVRQLTLANVKNDDAVLSECARLVETLRQGWDGMADAVRGAARVAA